MGGTGSPSPLQPDHGSVQYAKSTWRALTTLATEHQHVLLSALDSRAAVESSGEVHQQHETASGFADSLQSREQSSAAAVRRRAARMKHSTLQSLTKRFA